MFLRKIIAGTAMLLVCLPVLAADPPLRAGDRAPELQAVDFSGREMKLEEFAGKYVYIDFWATWCQPCLKEIPYLLEMEKELAGRDIVIVGFSWETNRGKWANLLRSQPMPGIQVSSGGDRSFPDAFGVDAIPHYVILDRQGIVVDPSAGRPSDPQTLERLLGLLEDGCSP